MLASNVQNGVLHQLQKQNKVSKYIHTDTLCPETSLRWYCGGPELGQEKGRWAGCSRNHDWVVSSCCHFQATPQSCTANWLVESFRFSRGSSRGLHGPTLFFVLKNTCSMLEWVMMSEKKRQLRYKKHRHSKRGSRSWRGSYIVWEVKAWLGDKGEGRQDLDFRLWAPPFSGEECKHPGESWHKASPLDRLWIGWDQIQEKIVKLNTKGGRFTSN